MSERNSSLVVVIPAAGVGKRMAANCPKQYLEIADKTILEHTVERLLSHPSISHVVIALGETDEYFPKLALAANPYVSTVIGGKERVDSVLAGLKSLDINSQPWVLVHDAARPCVTHQDLTQLIENCIGKQIGGLLAAPVRDTMKQANSTQEVAETVDRSKLWHAYTPQMYKTQELVQAIESGLANSINITDESSAVEAAGIKSQLIEGRSDNIKITRADDLALAQFILTRQQEAQCA